MTLHNKVKPPVHMFMIVLTSTLSDLIAIFKTPLENHNSIPIHTAKYRRITQWVVQGFATHREESSQTNVIWQYKLLAEILSAVCSVIQQS